MEIPKESFQLKFDFSFSLKTEEYNNLLINSA